MIQLEAFDYVQNEKYRKEKMDLIKGSRYVLIRDKSAHNSFHNLINAIEHMADFLGWKCVNITSYYNVQENTSYMFALMEKMDNKKL